MINSFHMNPWLYLLTIPICGLIYFIIGYLFHKNKYLPIISSMGITLLILLIIFFYLYLNNIIGLFDLILLFFIFSNMLNPLVSYTSFFNILLIPIATILSFNNKK